MEKSPFFKKNHRFPRKFAKIIFPKVVQDRYGSVLGASGAQKTCFRMKKRDFSDRKIWTIFFELGSSGVLGVAGMIFFVTSG